MLFLAIFVVIHFNVSCKWMLKIIETLHVVQYIITCNAFTTDELFMNTFLKLSRNSFFLFEAFYNAFRNFQLAYALSTVLLCIWLLPWSPYRSNAAERISFDFFVIRRLYKDLLRTCWCSDVFNSPWSNRSRYSFRRQFIDVRPWVSSSWETTSPGKFHFTSIIRTWLFCCRDRLAPDCDTVSTSTLGEPVRLNSWSIWLITLLLNFFA